MFYLPPLPKFKPSWKARKVKAQPIESVVKDGSSVIVWRSNNASTRPLVRTGKKALSKSSASSVKTAGSPSGG